MTDDDQRVLDLLSELLAVETNGARMYARCVDVAAEDRREKLIEYAEQSRRHCLVIEQAIRELGGDPDYVSPGAAVANRMTEGVIDATEGTPRAGLYRLLHLISFETQDRLVWEALDAVADARGERLGEVLRTAATAVLSEEALGAHMQDRSDERIEWLLETTEAELADELGVEVRRTGRRHGLHRPR
ncbi:MAG TPA: hypothetical protein VKD47_09255 [Miltoncostaeaceae bacterium]|nr:hypothetical protein [Miltoncostaeaceae bacterium]